MHYLQVNYVDIIYDIYNYIHDSFYLRLTIHILYVILICTHMRIRAEVYSLCKHHRFVGGKLGNICGIKTE